MSKIDTIRAKVQRILTDDLGSVQVDKDGRFSVQNESSTTFIAVYAQNPDKGEESDTVVDIYSPLILQVKLTPAVLEWVALEGHKFGFGTVRAITFENDPTGLLDFRYSILGDDLDPAELLGAVYRVAYTANDLDDKLKAKFGGRLFTEPPL